MSDGRSYLRFGGLPAGGRSTQALGLNIPNWPREIGVSVFEAERTEQGWAVLVGEPERIGREGERECVTGGLPGTYFMLVCERRPIFRAYGRVVGRGGGGDGEPLLADARLEEISPEVPIYASPSRPHLDFWTTLYNGWRAGGFRGFAVSRGVRQKHPEIGVCEAHTQVVRTLRSLDRDGTGGEAM